MKTGSTTQEIDNFWSHAQGGMKFSELIKQSPDERAEWCAAAAGTLAVETTILIDSAQSEQLAEAAQAA